MRTSPVFRRPRPSSSKGTVPIFVRRKWDCPPSISAGFTVVELLVATVLTLMLMTAVVQVFSSVGNSISNSRSALEQIDRLRAAQAQLRQDLQGLTVTMLPPRSPETAEGYFEYIEGPHAGQTGYITPVNDLGNPDNTVGELGDKLMFTTRSTAQPFTGRYAFSANGSIQSYVAEVAWFVRGRTLHRRVLLVVPSPSVQSAISTGSVSPQTFFQNNDISVRVVNGKLIANSLADLTKREWRFAHPVDQFPFDAARWGQLGLPTLRECSSSWMSKWTAGTTPLAPPSPPVICTSADIWGVNKTNDVASASNLPENYYDPNNTATRYADDIVLDNVIGFDVKAWDYKAQQYVDLGAGGLPTNTSFPGSGTSAALTTVPAGGNYTLAAPTYDPWSQSYENEGVYHYNTSNGTRVSPPDVNMGGRSTNGFDDDNDGIVDDQSEQITAPPYLGPLRGIQVKIRVFEPSSRQVREVTVEQDFLPK